MSMAMDSCPMAPRSSSSVFLRSVMSVMKVRTAGASEMVTCAAVTWMGNWVPSLRHPRNSTSFGREPCS